MIQILDISIMSESNTFGDLGRFVNLRFLRIRIDPEGADPRLLYPSFKWLHVQDANPEDYAELDFVLASFPLHIMVELEIELEDGDADDDDYSLGSLLEHPFDSFPRLRVCTAYRSDKQITARWRHCQTCNFWHHLPPSRTRSPIVDMHRMRHLRLRAAGLFEIRFAL
ncbi:hypothetical protein R3P38DRAFT_3380370, partial [Favolaschia claudopus]